MTRRFRTASGKCSNFAEVLLHMLACGLLAVIAGCATAAAINVCMTYPDANVDVANHKWVNAQMAWK